MRRYLGLAAALLMMIFAACGALAEDFALSVRRADGTGEAVSMFRKDGGQRYLFLPAYMDGQMLELDYTGADAVRMGDMALASGGQTDALHNGATLHADIRSGTVSIEVMFSANLPAVHVTTESGSLAHIHKKKGNREPGHVRIVTADGAQDCDAPLDTVKGHGNATFVYEKKSYQIRLTQKRSLLGMGEGRNFVLLANQHENSLMRNRITFDLARAMGLAYTPECRSVDLYVNGEYRGSYLLCDKVKISAGCVDITDPDDALEAVNGEAAGKPYGTKAYEQGTHKGVAWAIEPEDVTGGYLFELEYAQRYADETSGLVTKRGQAVVVKAPEDMSRAQGEYASALWQRFEDAVFSADGIDPGSGQHYTDIADFDSLVRKYMIEEVCKNYDANKSSQYFYKESDSVDPKLYAGPVWDYDSAWGNYAQAERLNVAAPTGLSAAQSGFSYSVWPALYRHEEFAAAVREVYDAELRPLLEVLVGERTAQNGVLTIEDYAAQLRASAAMNFKRWRVLNHETRAVKTGATYEENVVYLRDWIKARMAYLDENW